jgi:hypothetical protein
MPVQSCEGGIMTIIKTMFMVGLLGLALHLELYWVAGGLVVLFLLLVWFTSHG